MSDTTTLLGKLCPPDAGSKECTYCLGMGCMHCLGKGTVPVKDRWPTPTDLADAQLELDNERVERALACENAKDQLKWWHGQLKGCDLSQAAHSEMRQLLKGLLVSLNELQRLEEGGAQ